MPDINKTNNNPDDFSNLIRQKLEDHRLSVDNDCWEKIELRMKSGRRRFVLWIGGSVAAIAAIIVLLLSIQHNNEAPNYSPNIASLKTVIAESPISDKTEKPELIKKEILPSKHQLAKRTISTKQQTNIISDNLNTASDSISITNDSEIELARNDNKPPSDSLPPTRRENKQRQSYVPDKILIAKANNNNNNSKWLLAASVSSGGGVNLGNSLDMAYDYANPETGGGTNPPPLGNNNGIDLKDFSDVNHSLPISFGINVRKDFNKYIGIETGLIYTYLSSKYKNTGIYTYFANQELHYLGIPANLVVYLQKSSKWDIYITIGGMGEKGIQLKSKQEIYKKNERIFEIKNKGGIDGIQWSFNASIGVSYNFYEDWSIYFEPRYSYYFDSNQPISIRTEKPNVFGIGAGLRYEF